MAKKKTISILYELIFVFLTMVGITYRFTGMNWNSGANLHPDEYGLTNTLTQLTFPTSIGGYFNTRISPISPYNKYDGSGIILQNGPDNRMRWGQWPIIMIRGLAELTNNTGYDELRLMGRFFSAFVDSLTVLLTFLVGRLLYDYRVGLMGAAFSSLAVLQIQQSHFMTVDNYAIFFSMLAMVAVVRIAQLPSLILGPKGDGQTAILYRINWVVFKYYLLFGIALGMALASKINLLPLAGMLLIASFVSIADLKLRTTLDVKKIFMTAGILIMTSYVIAAGTFRVAQPMSFRASTGDTTLLTFHLNPDWVDSMNVSISESRGEGGGPPAEQWADRPVIIFPLMNMVVWGLGLTLGLAAWYGWGQAAWQIVSGNTIWRQHILPVVWVGGYFLFMSTRWVKSIRYFLPIYPFLCLLAAWGLFFVMNKAKNDFSNRTLIPLITTRILAIAVTIGTLAWATAFTQAVYGQTNTRIQATRWILQNIPGPIHIMLTTGEGEVAFPVPIQDGTVITSVTPITLYIHTTEAGKLTTVTLPHVYNPSTQQAKLLLSMSLAENPQDVIGQTSLVIQPSISSRGDEFISAFNGELIFSDKDYVISLSTDSDAGLTVFQNKIAVEEWDEGLPVPLDGYNPYDGLYSGITMLIRWTDDDTKRETLLNNLEQADYIVLSSQRALWSVIRLQKMYPMTIEYYRALFDGSLGFKQVAAFQAPWRLGPLQISDAGGTLAWGNLPRIPIFNFNFFAAEEAFTVYDHPPVWIFKKGVDYSPVNAFSILHSVDLTQASFQSPYDVKVKPLN